MRDLNPGHRRFYVALTLLAIVVVAAQAGAYYYFERIYVSSSGAGHGSSSGNRNGSGNSGSGSGPNSLVVYTLINYGNGTSRWYNRTDVPIGWDFYQLTVFLANGNVVASYYGYPLNEHYVTGINSVSNRAPYYWTLWVYCQNNLAWSVSNVGADLIRLHNNLTLSWYYQVASSDQSTWQPPVPGSATISQCS